MRYLEDLILKNRSYRKFDSSYSINKEVLICLIDQARKVASGKNAQPLKYRYCIKKNEIDRISSILSWASLYSDWKGPDRDEMPSAYIIICKDMEVSLSDSITWCDIGIAAQTILLCATEQGLGGCLLGSFDKKKISDMVQLKNTYIPQLIIAIGKPIEHIILEDKNSLGMSTAYYLDEKGIHHVPKRTLNEILINT